jgi:hypothetical protein
MELYEISNGEQETLARTTDISTFICNKGKSSGKELDNQKWTKMLKRNLPQRIRMENLRSNTDIDA